MSEPGIIIFLPFEAAPTVVVDAMHDGDETRIHEWLDAHPDYRARIDKAHELGQRARAA